jgi:hypothetical protein
MLRQCVKTQSRVLGADHASTLSTNVNLCAVLAQAGRLEEAEKLVRQTLDAARRVLGPDDPQTARTALCLQLILADREKATKSKKP